MTRQHQNVIAVRVSPQLSERYTRLAELTGRSRGYYMRLALESMIAPLEDRHWGHEAAHVIRADMEEEFAHIITKLYETNDSNDG